MVAPTARQFLSGGAPRSRAVSVTPGTGRTGASQRCERGGAPTGQTAASRSEGASPGGEERRQTNGKRSGVVMGGCRVGGRAAQGPATVRPRRRDSAAGKAAPGGRAA